ncbi:hypothetical protein C5E02_07230 [Rathayibacter rathayi]|uniref:Right handed beta helix domain-containing protein n=1 Tax=Rathayibacter rathayi TaxID=33887 RepID=A0ABD6WAS6_RATRA|nr:hypothetical protein [Rathayibacter rathayi]AZZ49054.1 hypothetical protein C1O28_07470 [Rathayibacter rathayi]MWV76002.1 hypothetical protein [Rathayibacter rathayi NCPPB 2980 = VKM Ac-1601]PPF15187.1 hypothetical protein C5C04_04695 [Rathayibacter rathayi]PPF51126.1 hypothetical protein C5C08_03320 [Rathayibacter rathayi]PPF82868.1 hypothetical protein C5C14_03010 [Rathayibacter rathayi]
MTYTNSSSHVAVDNSKISGGIAVSPYYANSTTPALVRIVGNTVTNGWAIVGDGDGAARSSR